MSQNIPLKSFQVKHKLQEDTQEVTEDIDAQRSIKQEDAANIQQELPHNCVEEKERNSYKAQVIEACILPPYSETVIQATFNEDIIPQSEGISLNPIHY